MIGLGVVVFVAVFAQGLKTSFIGTFDNEVRAASWCRAANGLALPTDTLSRRAERGPV